MSTQHHNVGELAQALALSLTHVLPMAETHYENWLRDAEKLEEENIDELSPEASKAYNEMLAVKYRAGLKIAERIARAGTILGKFNETPLGVQGLAEDHYDEAFEIHFGEIAELEE